MIRLSCASFAALSVAAITAFPALAQTAPIRMGQTSTRQAIQETDANLARQSARILTLEEELQRVTGRMEALEFRLGQSEQTVEDLERDNRELLERLSRLEGQVSAQARQPRPLPPVGSSVTTTTPSRTITTTQPNGVIWSDSNANRTNEQYSSGPQDLLGEPKQPSTRTIITNRVVTTTPAQTGSLGTLPASALPGEAGALFALGKNRLINFDYEGAEAAFRKFLDEFGDDPQAGEAHYWLGEALFQRGDFAGSARFFTDMLRNYEDDPRRGEALVKLARSLREVGETERACAFLSRLDDVAPDASNVTRQRVLQEQQRSNCS